MKNLKRTTTASPRATWRRPRGSPKASYTLVLSNLAAPSAICILQFSIPNFQFPRLICRLEPLLSGLWRNVSALGGGLSASGGDASARPEDLSAPRGDTSAPAVDVSGSRVDLSPPLEDAHEPPEDVSALPGDASARRGEPLFRVFGP